MRQQTADIMLQLLCLMFEDVYFCENITLGPVQTISSLRTERVTEIPHEFI